MDTREQEDQRQRQRRREQEQQEQEQGQEEGREQREERLHGEQPVNNTVTTTTTTTTTTTSTASKPKRKINRPLASCFGCRKRKTRCDRDRPCSECFKRNLSCDYSGAISPPIIVRRKQTAELEREEYIKSLEARLRALEQTVSPANNPCPPHPPEEKQDFSADDLAAQLSTITIGQRVRCSSRSHQPHPLQVQLEHILSSRSAIPRTTFIQPDQQFSLNLAASNPIPSLEELCHQPYLPSKTDIEFLAEFFFNSINLWSSCLNRTDWKAQLDAFWNTPNRLQFRPSPRTPDPPHLTEHYLAQFLSTIYGVTAHGLLTLADIHHLDAASDNQSNSDSSAASSPSSNESPWNLGQAEKISLANRWFRFSLGLLTSPPGDIYVKPTMFGIRAMSILGNVELAPENIDHGIFFWTLSCNVGISAGLFREPPITDDEVLETLDEIEIESRRWLAWHLLSLDWAGHSISGGIRPRSDPDQFSVKIPGAVPSAMIPLHPVDGWPLDPLICIKKVSAVNDCLMQRANNKVNSATYQDVLEMQREYKEIEESIPPRLQCKLSENGKSLEPVVKDNPIPFLILAFLRTRFCISRVRLLRLFIFPKKGVTPEEQRRQMEELLRVSRVHFLGVQQFSHTLNMHPLLIYSLVNTAVACALVLLINRQTRKLVIDEEFFLVELNKVIGLFNLGKKTMAATMASKAVSLLQTLVRLIERRVDPTACKSLDGRKKGPGVALQADQAQPPVHEDEETKKRKKQSNSHASSFRTSSFPPPSREISGLSSHNHSRSGQQMRHDTGFRPNHSVGSSNSLGSSAFMPFSYPSSSCSIQHTASNPMSSSAATQYAGSNPMDAFTSQITPPLVSSHPLQRSALSNSSSSSHISPRHYATPDQLNHSESRRVAPLPHNLDNVSNAEFGSMDSPLTNYQFNFPIFNLLSSFGEHGVQLGGVDPGVETAGDSTMFSEVLNHDLSFQFQPTTGEEHHNSGLRVGNVPNDHALAPFQPTFDFDTASINQAEY